jgi:hypothetical protein
MCRTVAAGTLYARIPHACFGTGTLIVARLRYMIINPVFLFSPQAEV